MTRWVGSWMKCLAVWDFLRQWRGAWSGRAVLLGHGVAGVENGRVGGGKGEWGGNYWGGWGTEVDLE